MMKTPILGWLVLLAASASAQSLDEAVNFPGLNLNPSGNAAWFSQSEVTFDGNSALQTGHIGDAQTSSIQGVVQGPGQLTFYWKVESEGVDYLKLRVDGNELTRISGARDWERFTTYLGEARQYTVSWSYEKDSSVSHGLDSGWLDSVSFGELSISSENQKLSSAAQSYSVMVNGTGSWATAVKSDWVTVNPAFGNGPGPVTVTVGENTAGWRRTDIYIAGMVHVLDQETALTSADAINNEQIRLTPVLTEYPKWFTQTEETHDGVDALQSGAIGHGQSTGITAEVHGPGTLSYWWKIESEGVDRFHFLLDGEVLMAIGGSQNWTLQSYELTEDRPYQLEWRYSKDGSVSVGRDAAWLDEVTLGDFVVTPVRFKASAEATIQPFEVVGVGSWSTTERSEFVTLDVATGVDTSSVLANIPANEGDWRYAQIFLAGKEVLIDQEGALTTNEAADNPSIRLYPVVGSTAWRAQPTGGVNDGDTLRSGAIGHGRSSSMETWVYGPGEFSFIWRTDSEGSDPMSFFMDESQVAQISGTGRNWETIAVNLEESRPYHMRWTYSKDGSINVGTDSGYVDQIAIPNPNLDWATQYFTSEELLQPEISGPNADPDKDGVPNRIERELGLIPTQSRSTITVSIEALSVGELQIRIQPMSESVSFHLESSPDLSTWSELVDPVIHFENGRATIILQDVSGASEFFRLNWNQ
jgi:hypothetical protein